MDIRNFLKELHLELSDIPVNKQLEHIQKKLNLITDKKLRNDIETAILIGYEVGKDSEKEEQIIILLHGIRTHAVWYDTLKYLLELDGYTKVFPVKYGYFDAFRFWFPAVFRNKPIRRVRDEIRDIKSNNGNSDAIVVAHSFGTYVISKILENETDINIKRLLLCGSIVKESFTWNKIVRSPEIILNDCGSRDVWPDIAKALSWGYGNSGAYGFHSTRVRDRFYNFKHSDFFDSDFMKENWLPFIKEGIVIDSEWDRNRPPASYLRTLFVLFPWKISTICVAAWMFI